MRRLLLAYRDYDPSVGYCQGMPFIVRYSSSVHERKCTRSKRCFLSCRNPLETRGDIRRERNWIKRTFSKLESLLQCENKRLSAHLQKFKVGPMMYASGWILTCFASDFTTRFSCRVMDVIIANANMDFTYGDFITNVAVSILNEATEDLLAIGSDEDGEKGEEVVFEKLVHIYVKSLNDGTERLNRVLTLAIHSLSERVKACREIERVTNTIV